VRTASGSTATALTANIAGTTAHDLLVVTASLYTGSTNHITSITDSSGQTWIRAGAYAASGHNSDGEIWYVPDAASVTSVVVHTAASSVAFQLQEYSGVAVTSPLDASTGTSNTSTLPDSGAVTVPAGDLVVGFIAGHGNAETVNLSSSYPPTQAQTTTSGSVASIVTGSLVQGAPGSANVTGSFGTAMYWAAGVVAFKAGP
jgi:hypothetical protein